MSVYRCYDCKIILCENCGGRRHIALNPCHTIQPLSDSYILQHQFIHADNSSSICDIQCLSNGMLLVTSTAFEKEIMICSLNEKQKQFVSVKQGAHKIAVIDKDNVAMSSRVRQNRTALGDMQDSVAIFNIEKKQAVYFITCDPVLWESSRPFFCLENQFYAPSFKKGLNVHDMSGTLMRNIKLDFVPSDMCCHVDSQRIYCLNSDSSELICVDKHGNSIFTFTFLNIPDLHSLTLDNDGNILVLCRKSDSCLNCVIKVLSNGKSCESVISNIQMSTGYKSYIDKDMMCPPFQCHEDNSYCISVDRLRNAVVIGIDSTVYIYEKNEKICTFIK